MAVLRSPYSLLLVLVGSSLIVSYIQLYRLLQTRKAGHENNLLEHEPVRTMTHIDLTERVPNTIVQAHIYGYTILDNIYFLKGIWYVVNADDIQLERVSKNANITRISTDKVLTKFGSYIPRVPGTTYVFTERQPMRLQAHYFHFAENLLGLIMLHSFANLSSTPDRIFFPTQNESTIKLVGWRDRPGMNAALLAHIFPNVVHISKDSFETMYIKAPFARIFDRIAISDRDSAFMNDVNGKWIKMLVEMTEKVERKETEWPKLRAKAMRMMGISTEKGPRKVITYVTRKHDGSRKFHPDTEKELEAALMSLYSSYVVNIINLGGMPFRKQVELVSKSDVLVGIHGNGFTHAIWMSPGASLIEIFPYSCFSRGYELVARLMGLEYYAVQNDRVFRGPEIVARGFIQEKLNNPPTPVDLHIPSLITLLENILDPAEDMYPESISTGEPIDYMYKF